MPHPEPEIEELIQFHHSSDRDIRKIINTVLVREGAPNIASLYDINPELAFILHDQIAQIIRDTAEVGDFEHELPREFL